jgi:hypothetical protein
MEGFFSTRGAGRSVSALLAVGALAVGLTACGSDSSSDSSNAKGSTSTVVKKHAGLYRDVQLEVLNSSPKQVSVSLCTDYIDANHRANCPAGGHLEPSDSAHFTSGEVSGALYSAGHIAFRVVNPAGARPYFDIFPTGDTYSTDVGTYRFSVGDDPVVKDFNHSVVIRMERFEDTENAIVMKMTVLK